MTKTKLTTIEWNVYNTLKNNTQNGKWTSMRELALINGVSERVLRKIIITLKDSDEIQKIIISDHKLGYKLLSNEKEHDYLDRKKIEILKKLKRYYKDVKRFNLNNQTKITFGKYERDYFESICQVSPEREV